MGDKVMLRMVKTKAYPTYISSPYMRIELGLKEKTSP